MANGYTKFFDPTGAGQPLAFERPALDRRDGQVYEFTPEIVLAVNVALATGRPLLVRGDPGSGKSSLAASVSRLLKWRYYEEVVSSRTAARDLLWSFDALARLNDAATPGVLLKTNAQYVKPGKLWWAFNRESARTREGRAPEAAAAPEEPSAALNAARDAVRAVILLDEIDKAEPDVPNDLLVPLGSLEFRVTDLDGDPVVQALNPPLVIITSNNERALPNAFMRRCVILDLPEPSVPWLVRVARAHFKEQGAAVYDELAKRLVALAREARLQGRRPPSTPEFLDAVGVCVRLNVAPGSEQWKEVEQLTLRKVSPEEAA